MVSLAQIKSETIRYEFSAWYPGCLTTDELAMDALVEFPHESQRWQARHAFVALQGGSLNARFRRITLSCPELMWRWQIYDAENNKSVANDTKLKCGQGNSNQSPTTDFGYAGKVYLREFSSGYAVLSLLQWGPSASRGNFSRQSKLMISRRSSSLSNRTESAR